MEGQEVNFRISIMHNINGILRIISTMYYCKFNRINVPLVATLITRCLRQKGSDWVVAGACFTKCSTANFGMKKLTEESNTRNVVFKLRVLALSFKQLCYRLYNSRSSIDRKCIDIDTGIITSLSGITLSTIT